MSAVNALIYPDAAVVLTDAAISRDGKPVWFGCKVETYPHLDAVIAYTGTGLASFFVRDFIGGGTRSFDWLCDNLLESIREGMATVVREWSEVPQGQCDILAIGYSTRAGKFIGVQASFDPATGAAGITITPVGPIYVQPFTPEIEALLTAEGRDPLSILSRPNRQISERVEALTKVMAHQRADANIRGHFIGGFQQATILERGEIRQRVVQEWPEDWESL